MFRALHSYLNLTSHSLLHLSPNVQPCWMRMCSHASSPSSSLRMLKSKESKPWKQRCWGGELGSPSNEVNTRPCTSYRNPARTGPNCKNARPNLLDYLVYWCLLIVPDCFKDMRVHLRLVRIGDLEVFEQQTAFETMLSGPCKANQTIPNHIVYINMHVLYLILSISSCHVLQQSPPNHQ